jgi:hypothetical protein
LITCVLALLAGLYTPHILGIRFKVEPLSPRQFKFIYQLCFIAGCIGLGLKLVDLIIYRNVEISTDFIENRQASALVKSSSLASAAAFLQPFSVAALVLTVVATKLGIHRRLDSKGVAVGIAVLFLPVIFGSRSTILIGAIEIGFLTLLTRRQITSNMILAATALFIGMLLIFALIFSSRLQLGGVDFKVAARYSAYTLVTPLNETYLSIIETADYATGSMLAAFASILQYVLSGVFEFFYLIELKDENFTWGARQFFFIPKAINVISGNITATSMYTEMLENPRVGVFQSLYGPMYIDFGYYAMVFAFGLGFFIETVRMRVIAGDYTALPLHLFLMMTLALAPMESGLGMNAGIIAAVTYAMVMVLGSFGRLFHVKAERSPRKHSIQPTT